jgi:glutathione S-transferase
MKALVALYENDTPFDFRILDPEHPENTAELARRWPVARFPLLVDGQDDSVRNQRDNRASCRVLRRPYAANPG